MPILSGVSNCILCPISPSILSVITPYICFTFLIFSGKDKCCAISGNVYFCKLSTDTISPLYKTSVGISLKYLLSFPVRIRICPLCSIHNKHPAPFNAFFGVSLADILYIVNILHFCIYSGRYFYQNFFIIFGFF